MLRQFGQRSEPGFVLEMRLAEEVFAAGVSPLMSFDHAETVELHWIPGGKVLHTSYCRRD